MRYWLSAPLLAASIAVTGSAKAQEKLMGAEAALRIPLPGKAAAPTPESEFDRRVMEHVARRGDLSPEEVGREWVELYYLGFQQDPEDVWRRENLALQYLPEPRTWPTIARALRNRAKGSGLPANADRLLASVLMDDSAEQFRLASDLVKRKPKVNFPQVANILNSSAKRLGDPQKITFAKNIEIETGDASFEAESVPDLVGQHGRAKAEPMLRRILADSRSELLVSGQTTRALVKRIALRDISRLKTPKWLLVDSAADLDLYQAMAKRFPKDAAYRSNANGWAFFGYIARGDRRRALALASRETAAFTNANASEIASIRAKGKEAVLEQTLLEIVRSSPTSSYYDLAILVHLNSPRMPKLVATLRAAFAKKPGDPDLRQGLIDSLLAIGRLREAAALLQKDPPRDPRRYVWNPYSEHSSLIQLGQIAGRPDWVAAGVTKVLRTVLKAQLSQTPVESLGLLMRRGNLSQAEEILFTVLREHREFWSDEPLALPAELILLSGVYHRAGRPADVRKLLDRSAHWGIGDVLPLIEVQDAGGTPFGTIVGSALLKTGEKAKGIEVLRATLRSLPTEDEAARLLVDAQGDEAIPFLEAIAKADAFEERPHIWIAYAHLQAGRLEEAEATIRKAISIDPSDGEQPHGRRMAAYEVLADVLKRQGKADEERSMRNVVAAIRLSERADDEREAGLIGPAEKTYKRSLSLFEDAYCIQSRLAIQLASEGRFEEAEKHYRRAYELMPNSFGRMESHCFGCEGVFQGERMQRIAEGVFLRLAKARPTQPQVPYLLGYLRDMQGDSRGALAYYRQAVKLDPDYLNAWSLLRDAALGVPGGQAEAERADLALARLDPLGRHFRSHAVVPIRQRYARVKSVLDQLPPWPTRLYPLAKLTPSKYTGTLRSVTLQSSTNGSALPKVAEEVLLEDGTLSVALLFTRIARR